MNKLVLICVFLTGLLHAYTGFALNDYTLNNYSAAEVVTPGITSTAGDADVVHTVHLSIIHHCSRQVNHDVFITEQWNCSEHSRNFLMYQNATGNVHYSNYLHLYPSHNFW